MICDWGSKVYVFFIHKKIGAFCMKFVPIISYKTNGTPWLEQIIQKKFEHLQTCTKYQQNICKTHPLFGPLAGSIGATYV